MGRRRVGGFGQERSIEGAVNRLVEAEHDRRAAQAELERFNVTYYRPEPPEEFAYIGHLVEYHQSVRRYEDALEDRKKGVDTAEKSYTQAAQTLRDVLPENVPLRYDYMGRRSNLLGTTFMIVKKQGEITVPEIIRPGRR